MFDTQRQQLQRAAQTATAGLAQLQAEDITNTYSEAEIARRRDQVLSAFDETAAGIVADLQQRAQTAQDELTRLEVDDPLTRLTSEQLARATERRWIIEEDATKLPYREVVPRARAALVGNDPATVALWARYLGRRLEAEQRAQPRVPSGDGMTSVISTTGQDPDMGAAWNIYRELSAKVTDPKREPRMAELRNLIGEAATFELVEVRTSRMGFDGGEERARAQNAEFMARAF